VISKDLVRPMDVLEPMVLDALERLSFGLEIVVFQPVVLQPGTVSSSAAFAFVYACKGKLIGKEHWLGNMTYFTDPTSTSESVDRAIQTGLDQMREQYNKQGVIANGSMPEGPHMPLRRPDVN
jgi:hypothetical protein